MYRCEVEFTYFFYGHKKRGKLQKYFCFFAIAKNSVHSNLLIRGVKKVGRLAGCGIKSTRLILKTKSVNLSGKG